MLTGLEMMACQNLAVPAQVMQHVVNVESSSNPYAIGVVGGQLMRQPQNLDEAIATVQMLESKGYTRVRSWAEDDWYLLHNPYKYKLDWSGTFRD